MIYTIKGQIYVPIHPDFQTIRKYGRLLLLRKEKLDETPINGCRASTPSSNAMPVISLRRINYGHYEFFSDNTGSNHDTNHDNTNYNDTRSDHDIYFHNIN